MRLAWTINRGVPTGKHGEAAVATRRHQHPCPELTFPASQFSANRVFTSNQHSQVTHVRKGRRSSSLDLHPHSCEEAFGGLSPQGAAKNLPSWTFAWPAWETAHPAWQATERLGCGAGPGLNLGFATSCVGLDFPESQYTRM